MIIPALIVKESATFLLAEKNYQQTVIDSLGDTDSELYELKENASDDDVKSLALAISTRIEYALYNLGHDSKPVLTSYMKMFCEKYKVRYPQEHELESIVSRLIDIEWWTKKIRIAHARKCEFIRIENGNVCRDAGLYTSNENVNRRRLQIERNNELLQGIKIQNESGYTMTLAEAANAGMANPYNRVSELITRTKGFGDLSDKYEHICLFLTITAPSKYHATNKNGKKNKRFQGFNPRETQQYLCKQWARCRARLKREQVNFYGIRVVEPHHDGTPHWHASIWLKSEEDVKKLRRAVKDYFLRADECSYSERGAVSNRLKFKRCDSRGAVGYMLKYILKNMRGQGIDGENSDEGKLDSGDAAERVEAWATTWAIRQFQQIGGHSVTVWRELRRVEKTEIEKRHDATGGQLENLMRAWRAAQKIAEKNADFAEFIEAMGGLFKEKKDALVCLDDEYVEGEGKYGLSISRVIHGVFDMCTNFAVKNNRQKWVVL